MVMSILIYVMVRLSIFDSTLVLLVGSLTALMGGLFGLLQNDLKRVIAFSTCSQLGYPTIPIINTDLLSRIFVSPPPFRLSVHLLSFRQEVQD
jgi:formate hydrogenlyase subunit 3/multisubunit Na+/H+ antiporter MnhD subunit